MDDFTELAVTLTASVGDARGSLILSRDGLVLGAGPEEAEGLVTPAWVRFASLGEPERGFVQFGTELWCYVRRGPYSAFVLAGTSVRPGLVLDQIDQALLAAEEARSRREGLRAPEPPPPPAALPTSKPRAPLHPELKPTEAPAVVPTRAPETPSEGPAPSVDLEASTPQTVAAQAPGITASPEAATTGEDAEPTEHHPAVASGRPSAPWSAGQMAAPRRPEHGPDHGRGGAHMWATGGGTDPADGDEEVDRFSLAREFSQLLQEEPNGADG
jgi:hypothetical protein